jgi:exonuclease SbcC
MVPQTLRLRNFLCYRDPPELDLRGVQVACLCGDNGHGKSALLDAMTWALWGWARGRRYGQGGASPDELVHLGQTEMEVSLDFWADGSTYRVLRKHSLGARGRSSATMLDLQMATADGYRSLGVGPVTGTERAIQRLLRMGYDTFVTTAFLLQGQADRFTASTPRQRKETLAEILGLSLYERLEQRAKEGFHEVAAKSVSLRGDLEGLEVELARRPEHDAALATARATLAKLEPLVSEGAHRLAALQEQQRALERQRQESERLAQELLRAQHQAKSLEREAQERRQLTQTYRDLLERREEVHEGARQWEQALRRLETLDAAQVQHAELAQLRLRLQHQVAQEQAALEAALQRLRDRLEGELLPRSRRLPQVEAGLEATASTLKDLQSRESVLVRRRQELQALAGQSQALEGENKRLHLEGEELNRKLELLVPGEATCPLCGTSLGPEGWAHLEQELETQRQQRRQQYRANREAIKLLEGQRAAQEKQLGQEERRLAQERGQAQARQGRLEQEREECRRAAEQLAPAEEQVRGLAARLTAGDFAAAARQEVAEVESALASLAYDPAQHQGARAHARALEAFREQAQRLQEAAERLPQEERSLATLETLRQARLQDAARAQERVAAAAQAVAPTAVGALEAQLRAREDEQSALGEQRTQLQQEAHLHTIRLEDLARAASEKEAREAQLAELERTQATDELLAEAFGKRGVQALLIESALPELENEANQLLGQLTEGRMSLSLETQRQSRRGEVSETLEVRVADELGTRSYELFSGGEAFRINFALRVALARLLASRAGAPLKSLFLDEGFGTQDAGGRQRLVEAIQSIQDRFDLILVITHIEELKEAFPVRIEVTKTEEAGSTFQMVWG